MIVKDFIDWLNTLDENLEVKVITHEWDWHWDGEDEFQVSYPCEVYFFPDDQDSFSISGNELVLGNKS